MKLISIIESVVREQSELNELSSENAKNVEVIYRNKDLIIEVST